MGLKSHGFVLLEAMIAISVLIIMSQYGLSGILKLQQMNQQLINHQTIVMNEMNQHQRRMVRLYLDSRPLKLCEYVILGKKSAYACK